MNRRESDQATWITWNKIPFLNQSNIITFSFRVITRTSISPNPARGKSRGRAVIEISRPSGTSSGGADQACIEINGFIIPELSRLSSPMEALF